MRCPGIGLHNVHMARNTHINVCQIPQTVVYTTLGVCVTACTTPCIVSAEKNYTITCIYS